MVQPEFVWRDGKTAFVKYGILNKTEPLCQSKEKSIEYTYIL